MPKHGCCSGVCTVAEGPDDTVKPLVAGVEQRNSAACGVAAQDHTEQLYMGSMRSDMPGLWLYSESSDTVWTQE